MYRRLSCLMVVAVALFASSGAFSSAHAQETLSAPTGPVILTVTGRITVTNTDEGAVFDLTMLDQLAATSIETDTPWTEHSHLYTGVSGTDLMRAVGASGRSALVHALNDYTATIPLSDFTDYGLIFATRRDGTPMSVRDMGPIFVVYPFDERPELASSAFLERSVWQVDRITVK